MNPALFLPLQYECCLLSYRPASTLPPLFIVLPALFETLIPSLCPNEETLPPSQQYKKAEKDVALEWFNKVKTNNTYANQGKDRTILLCLMYTDEGSRILREFSKASKNRPNPKRSKFGEFSYFSLSLSVAIEIERPCARASEHKHRRERSGLTSCRCFKFRRVAESFSLRT
jgi:hypothetical protein